jgi:hypothetical protein
VRDLPWRRPEPGLWAGPAASATAPAAPAVAPELHRRTDERTGTVMVIVGATAAKAVKPDRRTDRPRVAQGRDRTRRSGEDAWGRVWALTDRTSPDRRCLRTVPNVAHIGVKRSIDHCCTAATGVGFRSQGAKMPAPNDDTPFDPGMFLETVASGRSLSTHAKNQIVRSTERKPLSQFWERTNFLEKAA